MTIELAKAKQILVGGANPENLQDYLDITLEASIGSKVDKDGTKVLSDENYTSAEKTKLSDLPTNATLTSSLSGKVNTDGAKVLSDNNFTTALKNKVDGLPEGSALTSALSGKVDTVAGKSLIADTPATDGKQYAIKDGVWAEVVAGGGDVEEAPIDGKQYARKNEAWAEIATPASSLGDLTDVDFGTPTEGQVLTYDATSGQSKFADASGFDPETPVLWGAGAAGDTDSVSLGAGATSTSESIAIGEGATSLAYESVVIGKGAEVLYAGSPFAAQGLIALGSGTKSGGVGIGYFGCEAGVDAIAIGGGGNAQYPIPTKAGYYSISIGTGAVASYPGTQQNNSSIAIGRLAEAKEDGSIAIGRSSAANQMRSVALGDGSTAASLNEIRLGNTSAIVKTQSNVVVVSDERDKADIQEHNLGLDFINLLTPVKWKSDPREAYAPREEDFETYEEYSLAKESWDPSSVVKDGSRKGKRFKYGLIAQQVKEAMDVLGTDFSGYVDDSVTAGGAGNKALAYTDFISPLILAVQQLSDRVETLEQQVSILQGS